MKTDTKRGFTLMELLVVIAIIGILASVVLASLSSARQKGANAKIKAEIANARAQAELYYDTNGNYTNICTTAGSSGGLLDMRNSVDASNGTPTPTCSSDADEWVFESALVGTSAGFFCSDWKGAATSTSASVSGTTNNNQDC